MPGNRRPLIWPAPLTTEEASAPAEPDGDVIPLIQFDAAPLGDVLKTLAREANLNLIFEPAVSNVLAQSVTVRLENVTARNVLEVLLQRHGLRGEENPALRTYRITRQ